MGAVALQGRIQKVGAHANHTLGLSPTLQAFVDPLPIPVPLKPRRTSKGDVYTMTMKPGTAQCHRDLPPTNILGYNGTFPGPMIRARVGRRVMINQINNLPSNHGGMGGMSHLPAVHMHGALVAPESDGHPDDGIPHGGSRLYTYTNNQRACPLWFHDHTHGATGKNVYAGLAGLMFLDDPKEKALRLPRGKYEIPLIIMDRSFNAAGQANYELTEEVLLGGASGDVPLVNGKVQPFLEVAARKYRFRILNASNSREYTLALSNETLLYQIGTDGGLLQRPKPQRSIKIAPSERIDVIVDFSTSALNATIILQNLNGPLRTGSIMQFRVTRSERDNAVIPTFLRAWEELPPPVVEREFHLNRLSIEGVDTWAINGFGYDTPGRPVTQVKLNTVEHWRFFNPTAHPHPMHLHLVQFQVVKINGEPQDASDFGWKDTVVVPPGSDVTIASRFEGFLGKYVFHCHNLEHEDFAMMSEFEVIP